MKKRLMLLTAMVGLTLMMATGCSNKGIDTGKVRTALASLTGEAKQNLDLGLKAIDDGNFAAAVRPLKTIAYKTKLEKEQRDILEDTITKAEAKAAQPK
jgi:hypothetical protein